MNTTEETLLAMVTALEHSRDATKDLVSAVSTINLRILELKHSLDWLEERVTNLERPKSKLH